MNPQKFKSILLQIKESYRSVTRKSRFQHILRVCHATLSAIRDDKSDMTRHQSGLVLYAVVLSDLTMSAAKSILIVRS